MPSQSDPAGLPNSRLSSENGALRKCATSAGLLHRIVNFSRRRPLSPSLCDYRTTNSAPGKEHAMSAMATTPQYRFGRICAATTVLDVSDAIAIRNRQ